MALLGWKKSSEINYSDEIIYGLKHRKLILRTPSILLVSPCHGFWQSKISIILNYKSDSPFLYQYDVSAEGSIEANQSYPILTLDNSFLFRKFILLHFII